MSVINTLVPARFLVLTAHLVMVITIFWSRGNNVESCLPLDFTIVQYTTEDNRLIIALSATLCLFAIELFGFFSGVSMFNSDQGVLCILIITILLTFLHIINRGGQKRWTDSKYCKDFLEQLDN